jgi:hypothetical protein
MEHNWLGEIEPSCPTEIYDIDEILHEAFGHMMGIGTAAENTLGFTDGQHWKTRGYWIPGLSLPGTPGGHCTWNVVLTGYRAAESSMQCRACQYTHAWRDYGVLTTT